ncbi:amino acid:proton antiporter [Streptomyces eurocidicus]|uniref:Amino acid transporter n=1 Tax=Streptomyces eurocidicus TaxID=66423 RepID=A0A2N8P253_STREU|nr:APC family permease [Streptomyces eurocidicus]MBB5118672.1 amino acid transporter [Streptomyces eurocidicus]MBF6056254.1 amino acid permease [Streptomyces eurocidicus]PNE35088.1 amino acid:proton antiporter [Streptomyces eurocidicus]
MTITEQVRDERPLATGPALPGATQTQFISWVTLAMMTTASVANLRPSPSMALYGLAAVFLYLVPAVVFLLPTALVSAELASGWTGGVYRWVSEGLSSKPLGFLAVWCQFAMTIAYYPSLLAYVASTFAYVVDPRLADNGVYVAVVIVVIYWAGVLISSRGTKAVAGLAGAGLVIGTLIPGVVLVVLGMVFLGQGNASAAPMDTGHALPPWTGLASLVLIVNNFLSYAGMEMNGVHVSSLREPGKQFPRSVFAATGLVLLIFILPALAISWVMPGEDLSLTAGVMQAFQGFFDHFHVGWLTKVVGVLLVAAALGGMLAWLAGPSKGLLMVARQEGYLPPVLQKLNARGVPRNIMVAQGALTTLIALLYAFLPDVSSAYWIFSVITTQIYLVVYLLMFAAVVRLRTTQPDRPRGFRVPAVRLVAGAGFAASLAAMCIGFVPPEQFGGGPLWRYLLTVGGGLLVIGFLAPIALLKFRKPHWVAPEHRTAPAEDRPRP